MSELNYRVMFIPAIERTKNSINIRAASLEQAKQGLDIIANYTLFLHNNGIMQDYSNAGWVEKLIDGVWEEVDEEEE